MSQLVVLGVRYKTDAGGHLHFWGEVANEGRATERWVRITLRLLDGTGHLVGEQSDILGLEWTLPGARNPFSLSFDEAPEGWTRYDLRVEGRPHDYDDAEIPQPHLELVAERLHYREIGRSGLCCSLIGQLRNAGDVPATLVKAAGTLYAADGGVVGVLSPYLIKEGALAPGECMLFELKYYMTGGEIANYTVQVQGRRGAEQETLFG